ncbi:helix-turn-helix domain-containing protein [Nakamurella aerolata]|uniref:helix-turn-helix domain-containing protein n=1 Tax=Nakamurella aerolata TaxID=1656892 RepID=UPI0024838914|nr:helix-turn-helix transcriptional regulator [Nakamurella aerolata]
MGGRERRGTRINSRPSAGGAGRPSGGAGSVQLRKPALHQRSLSERTPAANRTAKWAGLIRRVRRTLDLSQRDLAEAIGVSPATIGRAETTGAISITVLAAILELGGIRLVALDQDDEPVTPMRETAARNHAGARYPAHLDAWIPTLRDAPIGGWRHDRPVPRLTFHHRHWRDERRQRIGAVGSDHSSELELRLRRPDRRRARMFERLHPSPHREWVYEECQCGPECETTCHPSCPCQCEPPGCNEGWSFAGG